jgi:hypothetical protein
LAGYLDFPPNKRKKMERRVKKMAFTAWAIVCFAAAVYAEDADVWITVTRMDQIVGSWEGSVVLDVPAGETTPAISTDLTLSLWYEEGADEAEMEMKIDFSRTMDEWSRQSGVSADIIWELLSSGFAGQENVEISAYSISGTDTSSEEDIIDEENPIFINESGTKLRFTDLRQAGSGDFSIPRLVLYRK